MELERIIHRTDYLKPYFCVHGVETDDGELV